MSRSIFLVLTSAIAIDGGICRANSLVEVSEREAENLLARGKARLATAEDGAPVAESDDEDTTDLSKLNKAQLLDLAEKLSIEGAAGMNKAELVEAIEAKHSEAK
ncbi:hypothetical protein [Pseudomonas phage Persinger]|uniref:Rho termination factor-like N-terminal domain-containing protein n=1 Tax=Pseudomonas phage Persinger TaxID=2749430 RepID=A0A7D7JBI7_9CAUD|nr:hypothetical protein KB682_gp44 [Pseudomonas phage Persinger]QMP19169.1 hypothetical protein [Pseudomonas phage Persinger]